MTQPKALLLADELEKDRWHITGVTAHEASEELRRLHDLLGKANALCRIRLDRIEKLEAVMVNAQGNLERISLVQTGVGICKQAQRQWVSLTEEEIAEIAEEPQAFVVSYAHSFARAIEAKIREKNNMT